MCGKIQGVLETPLAVTANMQGRKGEAGLRPPDTTLGVFKLP